MTASLKQGIAWIAENDDTEEINPEYIKGYISTLLLADLFQKEPEYIAQKIVEYRVNHCFPELKKQGYKVKPHFSKQPKMVDWGDSNNE